MPLSSTGLLNSRVSETVKDEARSGRPLTVTTPENIDLALDMVMEDQRLSSHQIVMSRSELTAL